MRDLTTRLAAGALCCLFILLGLALIPYAGVQNDEALFTVPIYLPGLKGLVRQLDALMVMSYVGTLKTWIFVPLFKVFGVSVWSVRIPMVIIGALTIWFFFQLCDRTLGVRAALLGTALLATDPAFLMTDTFDWGPVAIEHFLLVTGCLFLVRFAQKATPETRGDLALGFFCYGLALWNKAIFIWALAGLVCAGLAVFRREIRAAVRVRSNVALAAAGFLLGALPLLVYDIWRPSDTVMSNAGFEAVNLTGKLRIATSALDGSGLFGFIAAEDWSEGPKAPSSVRGRLAFWIRGHFGEHRKDGLVFAFVLALLSVPWRWRSRAARFSLLFLVIAWYFMAFTRGAGGAVHHAILLWPFPHMFIAAVFSRRSGLALTGAAATMGLLLVVFNLLVVNQYVYQLERNGAAQGFTDALNGLSDALADPPLRAAAQPIYVVDWGMLNTLELFHRGRLALRDGTPSLRTDGPSLLARRTIDGMLSDSNALFIGHTPPRAVFPDVAPRLNQAALSAGLRKDVLRTISDSNGHPVFEIFRFERRLSP